MTSKTIYTPYTYLIGWTNHNKWYYGRRTAKNCHPRDLWVKYFTSSKYVKQFIKDYGDPDIIQIRKTFDTPEQCCKWESKLLSRINAAKLNNFLNCSNGDQHWHTHNSKLVGKYKRTKEIVLKQSVAASGKAKAYNPKTNDYIGKISTSDSRWKTGEIVGLKHKWTTEQKLNQSCKSKGKSKTNEHNKNVSLALKGKPKNKVCRICDRKEMSVANFKKYDRDV